MHFPPDAAWPTDWTTDRTCMTAWLGILAIGRIRLRKPCAQSLSPACHAMAEAALWFAVALAQLMIGLSAVLGAVFRAHL